MRTAMHINAPRDTRYTEWQQLGNAVIVQAVKDYRRARKRYSRAVRRLNSEQPLPVEDMRRQRSRRDCAAAEMRRIEQFFLSDWFTVLSRADGQALLETLRKEVA